MACASCINSEGYRGQLIVAKAQLQKAIMISDEQENELFGLKSEKIQLETDFDAAMAYAHEAFDQRDAALKTAEQWAQKWNEANLKLAALAEDYKYRVQQRDGWSDRCIHFEEKHRDAVRAYEAEKAERFALADERDIYSDVLEALGYEVEIVYED